MFEKLPSESRALCKQLSFSICTAFASNNDQLVNATADEAKVCGTLQVCELWL